MVGESLAADISVDEKHNSERVWVTPAPPCIRETRKLQRRSRFKVHPW